MTLQLNPDWKSVKAGLSCNVPIQKLGRNWELSCSCGEGSSLRASRFGLSKHGPAFGGSLVSDAKEATQAQA